MRPRSLLIAPIVLSLFILSLATMPALAADNASFVSQSGIPTTMTVGETKTVTVTMKNTGTTTWTRAAGFKLGSQNPQDNFTWGPHRIWLTTNESILPGQQRSFTFTITAPLIPGSYNFQWQMVHESEHWFGAFSSNRVIQVNPAVADDSDFVFQSVPTTMTVGETRTVTVTMKNTGTATWTRTGGYKLGSQNPQGNFTWGFHRVWLSTSDSIPQGSQKSFTFNITAPSTPGSYNFQWQMVHESVHWFGAFSSNRVIQVNQQSSTVTLCSGVTADNNFGAAANSAIQQCINQTPTGGTLQIPAGTYRIAGTVTINKRMTFRTTGTAGVSGNCEAAGVSCAILKADPALNVTTGLLNVSSNNVVLDHLIIDGNRGSRLTSAASTTCQSGNNRAGTNIFVSGCTNCSFTKSVTREALCGTGLSWVGDGAVITSSVVRNNGNGITRHLWADGLTLLKSNNATVTNNLFVNNSDVSLIMGGSTNSTVTGNTIQQNDRVVFAAFMLSNFNDSQPGIFTGTTIANNTINCGGGSWCDFGIMLGHHPWQVTSTLVGGTVRNNSVANTWQPINIDGAGTAAGPITVYSNTVTGFTARSLFCGPGQTSSYNINTADSVVNRNGDTAPITQWEWHNCSGPQFRF